MRRLRLSKQGFSSFEWKEYKIKDDTIRKTKLYQ